MEGRRVEGVLLDSLLARNKAHEAYEISRNLEIRILSQIPETLLSYLGESGDNIRARVKSVFENRILLSLREGIEIEAENRLSVPVNEGDELILRIENLRPLVLKVLSIVRNANLTGEKLSELIKIPLIFINPANIKEGVKNSGIFYEKKIWDFIRGILRYEELSKDEKFRVLKLIEGINTAKLERFLKTAKIPEEFRYAVEEIRELLSQNRKAEALLKLSELLRSIERAINENKKIVENLKNSLVTLSDEFVKAILKDLKSSEEFYDRNLLKKINPSSELFRAIYKLINRGEKNLSEVFKFLRIDANKSIDTNSLKELEKFMKNHSRTFIEKFLPFFDLTDKIKIQEAFLKELKQLLFKNDEASLPELLYKNKVKELEDIIYEILNRVKKELKEEVNVNIIRTVVESFIRDGKDIKEILKSFNLPQKEEFLNSFEEIFNEYKETLKKLARDMENLKEYIENSSEGERISESLKKLENINYLQSVLIHTKGKAFMVPFHVHDSKGILMFSLREAYRIIIKLELPEGFLGIFIEAPKKEKPDYISILFKTGSIPLKDIIERGLRELKRELEALNLKVKELKVVSSEEKDIDREIIENLASGSILDIRV